MTRQGGNCVAIVKLKPFELDFLNWITRDNEHSTLLSEYFHVDCAIKSIRIKFFVELIFDC